MIEYKGLLIRPVLEDVLESRYEAQGQDSSYLFRCGHSIIIRSGGSYGAPSSRLDVHSTHVGGLQASGAACDTHTYTYARARARRALLNRTSTDAVSALPGGAAAKEAGLLL